MRRREFWEKSGQLVLVGALAIFLKGFFINEYSERRFTLYNIRNELKLGMSKEEVKEIIKSHDAPFLERARFEDMLVHLEVRTGRIDWLYLNMEFSNESLVHARFSGEDNPQDVPSDAPANLE